MLKTGLIYLVFGLFIYFVNYSEGLRILAIYPVNARGHYIIGERLARGLAEKGHQVDVYSHFPLKKPVPNYNDFSLAGSLPSVQNNFSYDTVNDLNTNVNTVIEKFGQPICDLLGLPVFQKLLKDPPKYDVVIIEVRIILFCIFKFNV